MLALLRIVELTEGSIFVDNVDISKIGLHDLRKSIGVIPQVAPIPIGACDFHLLSSFRILSSFPVVSDRTSILWMQRRTRRFGPLLQV